MTPAVKASPAIRAARPGDETGILHVVENAFSYEGPS